MGGEWSLGIALVMEIWPEKSRALLAGLIGAAANVGFLLIALVGLGLSTALQQMEGWLAAMGLPESYVQAWWRIMVGAAHALWHSAHALLTFFINLFVPESERWQQEQKRGATSRWATRDLLGVAVGALGACAIIYVWAAEEPWLFRLAATAVGLLVAAAGYMYPVVRYLQRSSSRNIDPLHALRPTLSRMLLGACLGGVALTSTWGAEPVDSQLGRSTGGPCGDASQICYADRFCLGSYRRRHGGSHAGPVVRPTINL